MDKFCTKCGSKLGENDKVCSACGTPVEGTGTPVMSAGGAPAVKKDSKNLIILAVAAVVCVLLLIGIVSAVASNSGYKGTVKQMAKAMQKGDAKKLAKLSSTMYNVYEIDRDEDPDEIEEYFEDMADNLIEYWEDSVDKVKKVSVEIKDASELKEKKTENVKEYFEDYYDLDTDRIKKIYKVKFNLEVKGTKKNKTVKEKNVEMYLIKEGGSWKIFYDDYLPGANN